ncbi:MAG TPA: transcription termination factor NusA [Anaerolineales bacterium]|nr:transcription termination factor NusA [Anaerolineales bacterium]
MKKEFNLAFNEVLDAKQLPAEIVIEAIETAMVSAYRKAVNASSAQQVVAEIDTEEGGVKIFAEKEVVDDVHDDRTEVLLEVAREYDPIAEYGDMVLVECTPGDFGRVAAQTARQVIQQRMREAERDEQFKHFSTLVGEVVNGVIQAINNRQVTLGLDKKAEGAMPFKEQIRGERFRMHDRVRALLLEVKMTPRGPQIILSRSHKNFLRRLLEDEVPEIYQGLVEIRSISREPGQRSKVAVSAVQAGIDPVGACVGVRGMRIQAIVRELHDEKIDVIEWNPDPGEYIAKALSPARVLGVFLDRYSRTTKTATVVVPEDQLSLAIGRDGQNARLAAKLTGWRIDIKSIPEAAADSLNRLQTDEEYAFIARDETEVMVVVEAILAKKAEGRPVPPEDYTILSQFITRVENRFLDRRAVEHQEELDEQARVRETVPPAAFEHKLDQLELTERQAALLQEHGFESIGDLAFQMRLNSDEVLALNGIGPKAMETIEAALEIFLANIPSEADAAALEAGAVEADEMVAALAEAEPDELPAAPAPEVEIEAAAPLAETEEAEIVHLEDEVEEVPEPAAAEPERVTVKDGLEEKDFDELFAFTPEDFGFVEEEEEVEEGGETEGEGATKKKKRKKRFSELEYDPERDITIVRRKRKRGSQGEWLMDDEWE